MVRLTRLKIDRFRNVKPGTDLRFGPTFNVLLGKNATGKTTLLDLIAAVTNDDLSAYAEEDAGFDLTWWMEKDENQIEIRAVRTPVTSSMLSERLRETKEFDDERTIMFRVAGAETGQLRVVGTRGIWEPKGEPEVRFDMRSGLGNARSGLIAALPPQQSVDTPAAARVRAIVFGLSGWGRIGRFDEAVAAIDAITKSPFEVSRFQGGSGGRFSYWHPQDFTRCAHGPTVSESFVISFDKLGSLASVPTLLGFVSAELHPLMVQRSPEGEKVTTLYHGFDCLFRRADGSQISHELLSFGQKRLFSFLWYLAVREDRPVVADELLNGLHHDWIQICLDRLYERQSFLATQHPYLLDHIPIESVEGVRTSFIRCTLEPGPDGREQMVWRNFTEEEAERFFIAYQTGVQQVSEVLRTEGLW